MHSSESGRGVLLATSLQEPESHRRDPISELQSRGCGEASNIGDACKGIGMPYNAHFIAHFISVCLPKQSSGKLLANRVDLSPGERVLITGRKASSYHWCRQQCRIDGRR
jgi:hypothetical protein